jgi:predicted nucleotidyltransferase
MSTSAALTIDAAQSSSLAKLCREYHVRELCIFGSVARGEQTEASDLDLLVDFVPGSSVGFLEFAGLSHDLCDLFGRRVDLVSKRGLKPIIRDSVLKEARVIYAE